MCGVLLAFICVQNENASIASRLSLYIDSLHGFAGAAAAAAAAQANGFHVLSCCYIRPLLAALVETTERDM